MSWKLPRSNVDLRVTRFSPDKPIAGLTPEARAEHRQKRASETRIPVRADGELSQDGRFRWSAGWAQWVPVTPRVDARSPLPDIDMTVLRLSLGPTPLASDRPGAQMYCRCGDCDDCWNRAQRQADYLKDKRIRDRGL